MGRRALAEIVGVAAALAALTFWQQLQDSTSPLRLALADLRERADDWRAAAKVEAFIDSIREGR